MIDAHEDTRKHGFGYIWVHGFTSQDSARLAMDDTPQYIRVDE